jgi:hypothetical protein
MTSWPTQLVFKRATECGCIAPSGGKSPKLQTCWEGRFTIITRINEVVYRIRRHPRAKMVVNLNRLAPYLGTTRDEQPRGGAV